MIQNTLFFMATIEKIIRLANIILGWLKMGERQVTCGGLVLGSVKKIKPIDKNKSCHNPIQTNQNAVFVIAVLLVNSYIILMKCLLGQKFLLVLSCPDRLLSPIKKHYCHFY